MLRTFGSFATLFIAASAAAADATAVSPHAGPVFAGAFANAAIRGGYAEVSRVEYPAREDLNAIEIAGSTVVLEHTELEAVARLVGAVPHREGEAGESKLWACLGAEGHALWLYSNGAMGEGRVGAVMLEHGPTDPAWGCGAAATLPPVLYPVPGLGTPRHAIEAEFGDLPEDPEMIGYRFERPSHQDGGFVETAFVVYRFADDVADAVAIVQITGD